MNWRRILCRLGWHRWLTYWADDHVERTSGGLPILYQRRVTYCARCNTDAKVYDSWRPL